MAAVQLIQKTGVIPFSRLVTQQLAYGWVLYGTPFDLHGAPAQLMVKGEVPGVEVGEYRLVMKEGMQGLEPQVKALLDSGWQLYGMPFASYNFPVQAVTFGFVPALPELGGGGEIPADLLIRLASVEGGLLTKASIVNGKVPYEQLPEFPVGRKVNVANAAARLALPSYGDLTIAYESDTGDAWGLDANDDPAVAGNWSKLGNTQAIGVASFNGRTGNTSPQAGDYTTALVTEAVDKRYVTSAQITQWNGAATSASVDTKIAAQKTADDAVFETKTHATDTFLAQADKGAASGVAPLDAGSKVPLINLPAFVPQRQRIWRDVKSARTHLGWWLNSSGNEMVVRVRTAPSTLTTRYIRAQIQKADGTGTLAFSSESYNNAATRWLVMELIVPHGYQYMFFTDGGTTLAGFEAWGELS
jgi:hypothetical protein